MPRLTSKAMQMNYLILVNPLHRIPADYFDNLELVEMRGYDDEIFQDWILSRRSTESG